MSHFGSDFLTHPCFRLIAVNMVPTTMFEPVNLCDDEENIIVKRNLIVQPAIAKLMLFCFLEEELVDDKLPHAAIMEAVKLCSVSTLTVHNLWNTDRRA
jgi:hypothetical protein